MTRSIYVAAPEAQTGESAVALGILDALTRQVGSIGVFRPLFKGGSERDPLVETLLNQPGIQQRYEDAVGITYDEFRTDPEEAMSAIVAKYGAIKDAYDAIVVLGSEYSATTSSVELTMNARMAANLSAPVAVVVSAAGRQPAEVRAIAENTVAEFQNHHARPVAVYATRVAADARDEVLAELGQLEGVLTGALPESSLLYAPTLAMQADAVGATLLQGRPEQLERESQGVLVCGMTLPNVLPRLFEDATVVLAGDRADMIPGLLLAHTSGAFPQLAGLILVGGYETPESVQQLVSTIKHELPIFRTDLGTYTTAEKLFHLRGRSTSSERKIETARRMFAENVDAEALLGAMEVGGTDVVTPLMFQYKLTELARKDRRRIVLPEASDDRILESAAIVLRRGTADLILLGDPTTVKGRASALGLSLEGAEIIDPADPELVDRFSEEYARLRSKKGVTVEQAREVMKDLSFFGTMMVHLGMADGMVSGAVNTTANTIRPSLQFIKTKPGVNVVSGSFLMCMPDRVDVYADCAVNPNPNPQQLADIAISSAETARGFGIEPRVAMLSYSTGTSGAGEDVDAVREATEIVREKAPELKLEGPIQFDAAIDPTVGKKKMPGSEVAGQATVFIFPDLNTGNNTYKAVQRTSGAVAIGPVLQGLNKPVNDLSRGALVEDIVNTIAITAIQAQQG